MYEGVKKVGETIKEWGIEIFSNKDDLKEWLQNYLNPSGFKSGFVELYEKLISWATIVYEWFRDKFLEFIQNIPKMVENWRKLRFSLFKWGTFLGGGGGEALWGMFGSGDNWGRLAELMGNSDFTGAVEKFGELFENNPKAFENMGEEDMKEIFQKMMDDPKDANDIAKELLEEQEKENEGNEGEKKELKEERIKDAFGKEKGGKPKNTEQALSDFIASGLKEFLSGKSIFGDAYAISKKALEEHINNLEKDVEKKTKSAEVKKQFLEAIKVESGKTKESLINSFARLSAKSYEIYTSLGGGNNKNAESLGKIFEYLMKEEFTQEVKSDEEGDAAAIDGLVNLKAEKNK